MLTTGVFFVLLKQGNLRFSYEYFFRTTMPKNDTGGDAV